MIGPFLEGAQTFVITWVVADILPRLTDRAKSVWRALTAVGLARRLSRLAGGPPAPHKLARGEQHRTDRQRHEIGDGAGEF